MSVMSPSIERELHAYLERLPVEQQQQVLGFARALAERSSRGVPGSLLKQFAGTIPKDELATMEQAIEEGCERIRPDEW